MIKPNTLIKMAAFAGASALVAGSAVAGDDCKAVVCDKAPVVEKPWTICNLFDNSTLYENDSNPFLQELALIGRYQGQWYSSDSNHGSDTDWENRRWRAGIKAKFLHDFEFDGQFNLKTDFHSDDRFIEDVEEVSIKWEATKDFYVQVGKFKPKVTNEWSTSSRNILTFERSLLVEQVRPEKLGGVAVGGKVGDFSYDLGIFEGAIDDDWTLPDFNGGISVLAKVGYKVTESTKVGFDYFYADQDKESLASGGVEEYQNVFSLNSTSQFGKFGLITDLIFATGTDDKHHSDAFGVVIMPTYEITEKLQAVFRYQYASADSSEGLRLRSRYERPAVNDGFSTYGDGYNAFYLGANYRICKDKLKLMAGVEYATMSGPADYSGWTYMTGIRMYY